MISLHQSSVSTFKTCRKKADLRYIKGLVPNEDAAYFGFGTAVHKGLELISDLRKAGKNNTEIDWDVITKAMSATKPRRQEHLLVALQALQSYVDCWTDNQWSVEYTELPFEIPLINPETGAASRTVTLGGRIDKIARRKSDGTLWVVEHKTASRVDAAYIGKLQMDSQIAWYTYAASVVLKEKIEGILYDVLFKPATSKLVPDEGETANEFETRASLLKNPKLAKRKMPETMSEFQERIANFYSAVDEANRPKAFFREEVHISDEEIDVFRQETWDVARDWADATRLNRWYRNSNSCWQWNQACPYLSVCQSRESPLVISAGFHIKESKDTEQEGAF